MASRSPELKTVPVFTMSATENIGTIPLDGGFGRLYDAAEREACEHRCGVKHADILPASTWRWRSIGGIRLQDIE